MMPSVEQKVNASVESARWADPRDVTKCRASWREAADPPARSDQPARTTEAAVQQCRGFYCSVGICTALVKQTQRENDAETFSPRLESKTHDLETQCDLDKKWSVSREDQGRERAPLIQATPCIDSPSLVLIPLVDSSFISQFARTMKVERAASYNANFALSTTRQCIGALSRLAVQQRQQRWETVGGNTTRQLRCTFPCIKFHEVPRQGHE